VAPRKRRIGVVLDTNVIVAFLLGADRATAVGEVVRRWREIREVQLIVSEPVVAEYLEVARRLGIDELIVARFAWRIKSHPTVTHVNLGPRIVASRDPDDDVFLTTARAGKAAYLITNDRDLLDIPAERRKMFRFQVVRPGEFLRLIED
jgi:putative PIN family toxin of toxin-antitoxin system